jgi:hypothetical protein
MSDDQSGAQMPGHDALGRVDRLVRERGQGQGRPMTLAQMPKPDQLQSMSQTIEELVGSLNLARLAYHGLHAYATKLEEENARLVEQQQQERRAWAAERGESIEPELERQREEQERQAARDATAHLATLLNGAAAPE